MIPVFTADKHWTVKGMFVFYRIVSNSLYCRVCLFLFYGDQIFVYFVSFLSMIIYEILHT